MCSSCELKSLEILGNAIPMEMQIQMLYMATATLMQRMAYPMLAANLTWRDLECSSRSRIGATLTVMGSAFDRMLAVFFLIMAYAASHYSPQAQTAQPLHTVCSACSFGLEAQVCLGATPTPEVKSQQKHKSMCHKGTSSAMSSATHAAPAVVQLDCSQVVSLGPSGAVHHAAQTMRSHTATA